MLSRDGSLPYPWCLINMLTVLSGECHSLSSQVSARRCAVIRYIISVAVRYIDSESSGVSAVGYIWTLKAAGALRSRAFWLKFIN